MSPVSTIGPSLSALPARAPVPTPPLLPPAGARTAAAPPAALAGESFARVFDQLVGSVEARQAQADAVTRSVLLGDQGQLHQSVIAMQEASVAFSLMVEVRNKLIDSYQELMRLPV
ncbi:MAG: flagellar hook-basal body complex protein FliE [Opitutaceae bacterium]|nr:flagellar hook-basal body complex protein FliE [Opitutaceae bacterium]